VWIVYFLNSKSHVDLNLDGWIDSGGGADIRPPSSLSYRQTSEQQH